MFVIMAYDVNVRRVTKVLKIGRKYLNWVQNSLLEGELTFAQLERLKAELKKILNKDEDSVVFYLLRRREYAERQVIGQEKGSEKTLL